MHSHVEPAASAVGCLFFLLQVDLWHAANIQRLVSGLPMSCL